MSVTPAFQMKKAADTLLAGDYKTGWELLEARHDKDWAKANGWSQTPRDLTGLRALDDGSRPSGILVHAEGGAGDTVQFARFVPLLAKAAGVPVVFEVQNQLVDLVRTFPGMDGIAVIPRTMADPADATRKIAPPLEPAISHAVALLSLPRLMGYNDLNAMPLPSFPTQPALPASGPLKVGLCWRADPNNKFDAGRDVPLEMLLPIINSRNVIATSLLDDMTDAEKATAPNLRVPNPQGGRVSFTAMADLIREQDVVISSDTVWPNLAATLGKPVQMFTLHTPNWRWGTQGEATPWYPTMQLLRQPNEGNWQEPVDRATAWVQDAAAKKALAARPTSHNSSYRP